VTKETFVPRKLVSSGSPLEPTIGFSRAVRSGPYLAVAGTAPIGRDGRAVHPGDVYEQTKACLAIATKAIKEAGGRVQDAVRTRVMLTDIDRWREAARAHGEFFGDIRPACTFMGVSRFIDPEWLVEVEIDCFSSDGDQVRNGAAAPSGAKTTGTTPTKKAPRREGPRGAEQRARAGGQISAPSN
jgi:enamine deaminase RidA (YjgF/YER057c/UK114 family)